MRGALEYNEKKVKEGDAQLIVASGFSTDIDHLSFSEKLRRFDQLTSRRPDIRANTLHIFLSFPPEEKPSPEELALIARDYMDKIGFGEQPFLVYQHTDTANSHIHIVTTNVQADGNNISLFQIGKRRSEPARKAIEQEYKLIPAESRKKGVGYVRAGIELSPFEYGTPEAKAKISSIVREITGLYKYTSLEELNAILRLSNIVCDPGPPGSRMNQNRGLVYCALDKNGNKIGIPIKASDIYTGGVKPHPTLDILERKFEQNKIRKMGSQKFVVKKVADACKYGSSPDRFMKIVTDRNIKIVADHDTNGQIKAIQFIDHAQRAVFTHAELGFSLSDILQKLTNDPAKMQDKIKRQIQPRGRRRQVGSRIMPITWAWLAGLGSTLIQSLFMAASAGGGAAPEEPDQKKKRKKRRR